MRWLTILAACLAVSLGASRVAAQPYEPTDEEYAHNAEALKLAQAGNYDAAITEQQKAVAIRGLNVFWLNLGRFQQHAKRCADAMESYSRAMTAPPVQDPSAETVRNTAQRYAKELALECPARVRLLCTPTDLAVTAAREGDENPPTPMGCDREYSLPGGAWVFRGSYGAETVEVTRELRIARDYEIPIVIDRPVAAITTTNPSTSGPADVAVVAPTPKRDSAGGAAVALVVVGSLTTIAGVVVDIVPPSAHNGELDGLDFVPLGLYVAGITLGVLGLILW